MKYFLDTEFHEYKKKPLIGKPIDTIELISIGIVSENDREYYAICKDFDLKAAWKNEWIRENVLKSIYNELLHKYNKEGYLPSRKRWDFKEFKMLVNKYGKTKKQIAKEIKTYIHVGSTDDWNRINCSNPQPGVIYQSPDFEKALKYWPPKFYAYYADYDWVVFCWLFGRMIDLPKGFPMYCIDLKQIMDDKAPNGKYTVKGLNSGFPIKEHQQYPKQTNEHNALSDAKWNKELYAFINNL